MKFDNVSIYIHRKHITVISAQLENVSQTFSCHDLKVLINKVHKITTDDNLEDILNYIHEECKEYIEKGDWKICDCWIENLFCYCTVDKKQTKSIIEEVEQYKWDF